MYFLNSSNSNMKNNRKEKTEYLSNLKNDLPASIVVFLVAVPLCLGIALASGAPLFSGIIAGIVGGIVVGALSGSQLGVSGPAAGLAAIVFAAIPELGGFKVFLVATVLAGLIQLILGFLRAGIIGYYFPSSVIKGMLAGIGLYIVIKQVPYAFGFIKSELALGDVHNPFVELFKIFQIGTIHLGALIITLVCMTILILWEQKFMKKLSFTKIIQGPLVAVFAGILLNVLFQSSETLGLSNAQVVAIPVAENLSGFFNQFSFPDFSQLTNPKVYVVAITLAIVASLETLLCLEAADKLDPEKRVSPANRELKAQGIGNMISGLIGGLPITQVIVRSSTNAQSGGKTKMSAIFHGFILLFSALAAPKLLNMIPLASLAAILFVVGYKLAKPAVFKVMYKKGWFNFLPFIVTIVGIIFTDLLIGIGLGLAVAIIEILYKNYQKPYKLEIKEVNARKEIRLQLSEDVTFLNKAGILKTLNNMPNESKVIIDASRSIEISEDVKEIIQDFQEGSSYRNIEVQIISRTQKGIPVSPVKEFEKIISKEELREPALAN